MTFLDETCKRYWLVKRFFPYLSPSLCVDLVQDKFIKGILTVISSLFSTCFTLVCFPDPD